MTRRKIGASLAVLALLIAVAASTAVGSPSTGVVREFGVAHAQRLNAARAADIDAAKLTPVTRSDVFVLLGAPGYVIEPADNADQAPVPNDQFDATCPNLEPCGP
jgi:type II secretory pathway pseudopilin PulG